MARKTKIVNLSLPQDIYAQVEELADQMGISKSEFLRKALKRYVASELRWQQIRKWGEETAKKLDIEDEDDVDRIIHEFRQEKVRC
jgi:metal-responsive CopG/Arc/MetJ family transcriptional regulator